MLKLRNFLIIFLCAAALSSCNKSDFPELRAENEENIFAEAVVITQTEEIDLASAADDGKVIIASVAKEGIDEKEIIVSAVKDVPKDEGVVIMASAAKEDSSVVKAKPILKEKVKKEMPRPAALTPANKKPIGKILANKEMEKINTVKTDSNGVVSETSVITSTSYEEVSSEPSITYQVDTFYFDNGSAVIKNEYKSRIKTIAKQAKELNATIYVLGFSSSRTKDTDYVSHKMINFQSSLARAENVSEEFIKAGVRKDKVVLEALSDSRPLYLEVMPEGERLNRRVEVYIGY
ncbi:MAG: OmpA family protein [Lactobacillaceae bacterium]|jgi:outer membrane protein OmpA-like peptidoglycan-associated protein|nr:OmpA family protein [Lactobacillaceae bacterium]